MHCLYGGYSLHRFSDALGLVGICDVSNFLYFIGGSTLYIESTLKSPLDSGKTDGDGSVFLTGHLGDVMKESAQIAHTFAKSFLMQKEADNSFLQKAQIHLHVPEVSNQLC